MKRFLAFVFALALCLSVFVGCGDKPNPDKPKANPLDLAKEYLYTMYKNATVTTPEDYEVVAAININGVDYPIDWTVEATSGSAENIVITPNDKGMVVIDVNEEADAETLYNLVATIKNEAGETVSVSFAHRLPEGAPADMIVAEVVEKAFALEDGATMKGTQVLRGEIVEIPSAYSADYKNITVNIKIGDKVIQCFRLKGGEDLKVGDVITVTGTIKNYGGTIEFDKGCTYSKDMSVEEAKQLLTAEKAYALENGATMKGTQVLRGEIVEIPSAYSADYKNITVNIKVGERIIQCFRLKGGEDLKVGDVITVTGIIKNYNGTVEFDKGCTYSKTMTIDEAKDILVAENAYALEQGATMKGLQELCGEIVEIPSAYSADYKNITVNIKVGERIIQCFRLKGGEDLKVGDVITVTGTIKNYNGTIEFDKGCTYVK